jgi:ABC-type Fe3+/spermidine/putrescine transport system ATPase subunit
MSRIDMNHIVHAYSDQQVLEDFSFAFTSGQITCLLGPSGSGKTTILRLIAGLETPRQGNIQLNGKTVTDNGRIIIPPHERKIGFIFQDLALWPHFTVYNNIAFGLKERKAGNVRQKVKEMLDIFGLADQQQKYPHQLSGGQKQMVAIARSLVLQPQILLMDEPLANIDVQVKNNILNHLFKVHEANPFTILYVTHDHHEAFDIGHSIAVMQKGNVVESGNSKAIRHSQHPFVQSFIKFKNRTV